MVPTKVRDIKLGKKVEEYMKEIGFRTLILSFILVCLSGCGREKVTFPQRGG